MDWARSYDGSSGFPHWIMARTQDRARGRRGRLWISNKESFLATLIMEPKCSPLTASQYSFVAACALYRSLKKYVSCSHLAQKWPNDVLLENKKICGILIESEMQQENLELTIGIGINYSIPKKESWWGDLGNLRDILPREKLINTILKKIIAYKEHSYSGWQQAWENRCMHQNLEINIQTNSHTQIVGIFRGVDNEGKMLLETINGTQAISSGECSITGLY